MFTPPLLLYMNLTPVTKNVLTLYAPEANKIPPKQPRKSECQAVRVVTLWRRKRLIWKANA